MNYPFILKCAQRLPNLPRVVCSIKECPWYIHSASNKNCFWVLAQDMLLDPFCRTNAEIAELEGKTEEEINKLFHSATKKVSSEFSGFSEYLKQ